MPGTFIDIELSPDAAADRELAQELADLCPVDVFAVGESGVELVQANLDECVLCRMCIEAAPVGALQVHKLYSGETL